MVPIERDVIRDGNFHLGIIRLLANGGRSIMVVRDRICTRSASSFGLANQPPTQDIVIWPELLIAGTKNLQGELIHRKPLFSNIRKHKCKDIKPHFLIHWKRAEKANSKANIMANR
ncbi:unnamed protein product [Dovyalis caffra]|uniref:Uncharacterized protein n=1 Tax=Dovyalis caffra TaxID=77055 RepID=A0AAV1R4I0_9ROSI|nr:unnamed protein product [Dovyalis caffra]